MGLVSHSIRWGQINVSARETVGGSFATRAPIGRALSLYILIGFLIALMILTFASHTLPTARPVVDPLPGQVSTLGTAPAATPAQPFGLSLGISALPSAICAYGLTSCPAGTGDSRVTLTASAATNGVLAWPDVQVAFVVETTLYDGVYDPSAGDPGFDPCTAAGQNPCEESNGVPFFVAHGQDIANSIAAANPHSRVSFALVDYFSTVGEHDDGDGAEYHVDIANFIPSAYFGAAVHETFQAEVLGGGYVYSDNDFADNMFHSSAITAIYGAIVGSGLNWANNTHHVVVWIGSTAPRDPAYPINYCITSSDYSGNCPNNYGATCEPGYNFGQQSSPNCEGWVHSHDGNATHSIAALARSAQQCTGSIGHVCTIDTIDLWTTPTDPYSKGWPLVNYVDTKPYGGTPGGRMSIQDANNVLRAGCDLAAATSGTWDGPTFYTCANGQAGTLQYIPHGPTTDPNVNNPTLLSALRGVGFGPVINTLIANGTNRPLFEFVPIGNIIVDPNTTFFVTCVSSTGGLAKDCQQKPTILHAGSLAFLGWNWSTNRSHNEMFVGDVWVASFDVMATGPPFATVPVDACTTIGCRAGGSSAIHGVFTSASYTTSASNATVITQSFPLAQVTVQFTAAVTPVPGAPAPPPPPPGILVPILPALPILQPIGIGSQVGVANVSLNATAAGLLAAGFMRVGIKNRPIPLKMAAMAGPNIRSKFEQESAARRNSEAIGRFE